MSDDKKSGSDDQRRWFPDPGGAAVNFVTPVVTALIGIVVGGAAVVVVSNNDAPQPEPSTVTVTETSTTTVAAEQITPNPTAAQIGLAELDRSQEVQFNVDAEFDNRSIGGRVYQDAVTGLVYSDGSGFSELVINTRGRFSSMQFVVGIDDEAECSDAEALASIEDERGRILWGPETIRIGHPLREQIALPGSIQVKLEQSSNQTGSHCDGGEAQVSWGGVEFASSG